MPVTAGFFEVLGVRPQDGRTFTEDEAQRRRQGCVTILGHDVFKRMGVGIGSTIRLDDEACEVIGVLPEGFGFRDDRVKLWTTRSVDAGGNGGEPREPSAARDRAAARRRDARAGGCAAAGPPCALV